MYIKSFVFIDIALVWFFTVFLVIFVVVIVVVVDIVVIILTRLYLPAKCGAVKSGKCCKNFTHPYIHT